MTKEMFAFQFLFLKCKLRIWIEENHFNSEYENCI